MQIVFVLTSAPPCMHAIDFIALFLVCTMSRYKWWWCFFSLFVIVVCFVYSGLTYNSSVFSKIRDEFSLVMHLRFNFRSSFGLAKIRTKDAHSWKLIPNFLKTDELYILIILLAYFETSSSSDHTSIFSQIRQYFCKTLQGIF